MHKNSVILHFLHVFALLLSQILSQNTTFTPKIIPQLTVFFNPKSKKILLSFLSKKSNIFLIIHSYIRLQSTARFPQAVFRRPKIKFYKAMNLATRYAFAKSLSHNLNHTRQGLQETFDGFHSSRHPLLLYRQTHKLRARLLFAP